MRFEILRFQRRKTAFMQMLGRVRVRDNQKLRLYIKAYTAQEIRNRIQYTCKIIHIMYNFYMLHQNEYSGMVRHFIINQLCVWISAKILEGIEGLKL